MVSVTSVSLCIQPPPKKKTQKKQTKQTKKQQQQQQQKTTVFVVSDTALVSGRQVTDCEVHNNQTPMETSAVE